MSKDITVHKPFTTKEIGWDKEKIVVTEVIELHESEATLLYNQKDSDNFEFVELNDNGFSMGYERTLVVARKKDTDAYYRFMAISYCDDELTFTKAQRVFLVTKTIIREDYTSVFEKEKHGDIIKTFPNH